MSTRDQVLQAMASDPARRWSARELATATHRPAGKVYPALGDLELRGLVKSGREPRHRARWWTLTDTGVRAAARHATTPLPRTRGWRPEAAGVTG